ncbi:oocyte zinc finger protein XlCOF29-like [Leptodactylus fuscus]
MQSRSWTDDSPRMDKDRSEINERILSLTLEIIYLLTGEDYTVVKKTSGHCPTPKRRMYESGGWSRSQSLILLPPPRSRIHDQKILELTNKIAGLLTGEVTLLGMMGNYIVSLLEWSG